MDSPRRAAPPATRALAEDFPALAYILGEPAFAALSAEALAVAARSDRAPGELLQAVVTRRIVRGEPAPWSVPSRLVADLAALEWAVSQVNDVPPVDELPLRRDQFPTDDDVVLVPVAGFRIVAVAFRLDAYLRRIAQGRRPPPPGRADQSIVVYKPYGQACRLVLDRGPGRMLSLLAVGTPVGEAVDLAVQSEWLPDPPSARDAILEWIGEGLFASVRHRAH